MKVYITFMKNKPNKFHFIFKNLFFKIVPKKDNRTEVLNPQILLASTCLISSSVSTYHSHFNNKRERGQKLPLILVLHTF